MLVVTPPRVDLLKGEVDKIKRFLERGGNLLWLIDQEPLHGLQPIAENLHLQLSPGVVVDPRRLGSAESHQRGLGELRIACHHRDVRRLHHGFPLVRRIAVDPEAKGGRQPRWWKWRPTARWKPET